MSILKYARKDTGSVFAPYKDVSYAGSWKSGLVRYVHVLQWLLYGATAKLVR